PDAAGELSAEPFAHGVDVADSVLAVRASTPRFTRRADSVPEEALVPRGDDVDGRAHERPLDDALAFERPGELNEVEPLQTRPQPDVGGRRVLRLQPATLLYRHHPRHPR